MNNDDLLKKIEKLFEVERKQTRQLIREENEAIEKRLTAKVDSVDMKVEARIASSKICLFPPSFMSKMRGP